MKVDDVVMLLDRNGYEPNLAGTIGIISKVDKGYFHNCYYVIHECGLTLYFLKSEIEKLCKL